MRINPMMKMRIDSMKKDNNENDFSKSNKVFKLYFFPIFVLYACISLLLFFYNGCDGKIFFVLSMIGLIVESFFLREEKPTPVKKIDRIRVRL